MIESRVIIVGGGPAGSTCAWKLKHSGVETIILDKKKFPRMKLCAGWITSKVLKDLELDLSSYPYSLASFDRLHFNVYGFSFAVKTCQYSIRRYEFDHWLLQRSDVPLYQHRVKNIRRVNGYYIIDDAYRCRYLVGAGGTNCPVYRTFFIGINPRARKLLVTSMEEEFPYDFQDNNCYLWFFERKLPGYSWYVPKGNGYVNVGIGGKLEALKSGEYTIRDYWNYFIKKLEDLSLVKNHIYTPGGYNYYLRQKVHTGQLDNAFIIGDAAGLATRDMGEGIGPAVESGIKAANAIIHGSKFSIKSITKYSIFKIIFSSRC